MIDKLFSNTAFKIALVLFVLSLMLSFWLLQDNAMGDLYILVFIAIPINITLLVILIFAYKKIAKS